MKKEIITLTILRADEGKRFANGSKEILRVGDIDETSFSEITEEEYFNSLPEEEQIAIRAHEERLKKEAEEKAMLESELAQGDEASSAEEQE